MSEHRHQVAARDVLRPRREGEHSRVSFFELFFDLVFVFAVTQLSHALAAHLTLEGVLQVSLLLLTFWWAWMYTTWATNWLDPDHPSVRLMLTAVMLSGLVMSAAIPQAFENRGLVFAVSYVVIQVGRSLFVAWATRADQARRDNFLRITAWFAVSAVAWIAGGCVEGDSRLALWTLAIGFEYLGPPTAFWIPVLGQTNVADWNVEGAHLAERCGLFIIIALGESLLVTGATFSGLSWEFALVAGLLASFAAAVALWWIYFDQTAEAGSELIAHSSDPGRLARLAYTYFHLPMVAGIILAAVGDERVLAHPRGEAEFRVALVILGGPALFLLGHWLFKRVITGRFAPAHLVAIGALTCALLAYESLPAVALSLAAAGVLAAVGFWGWLLHRPGRMSSS